MRYFISAGEASGDMHGAPLIEALKSLDNRAEFRFLGGDGMAGAAGQEPLIHYREMAYMGFSEVLRNLGKVLGNLKTARREISSWHPDAVVLIDYPSFNLKLAKHAYNLGIPVYYMGMEGMARKRYKALLPEGVVDSAVRGRILWQALNGGRVCRQPVGRRGRCP